MGTYSPGMSANLLEPASFTIEVTPTKVISTAEKPRGVMKRLTFQTVMASPGLTEIHISDIRGVNYQKISSPSRWSHYVFLVVDGGIGGGHGWRFKDKEVAMALREELLGLLDAQIEARDEDTRESGPTGALSLADELKKLAELRDSGILTETEFDAQKAKLLESD